MSRPLESTVSVLRVGRLDGRTRVVATYTSPELGWTRVRGRLPFIPRTVDLLRLQGVRSVELRRGFSGARMPLAWIPASGLDDGARDAHRPATAEGVAQLV